MTLFRLVGGIGVLLVAVSATVAQGPKRDVPELNVKAQTKFPRIGSHESGVVTKVDENGIVLSIPPRRPGLAGNEVLFPVIDLLADGKVHSEADDRNAYRLSDLQEGDTVSLGLVRDDGNGLRYCVEIQLDRRPKGKIPPSQNPDPKRPYHERADLINRILNGEEVDEKEVDRVCPLFTDSRSATGVPVIVMRKGMPQDVKMAYDAQVMKRREEKELKAKSNQKKDDKK